MHDSDDVFISFHLHKPPQAYLSCNAVRTIRLRNSGLFTNFCARGANTEGNRAIESNLVAA